MPKLGKYKKTDEVLQSELVEKANKETEKKAKRPSFNPEGRKKIPIDYDAVERLSGIMCTQEEIASYLGISVRTLLRDETFCQIYKKGINKGKMSFRRQQYRSAESGNVTMQIWLGKQYLGQSDKRDYEHSGDLGIKVVWEDGEEN